jgi:hypothetical protein
MSSFDIEVSSISKFPSRLGDFALKHRDGHGPAGGKSCKFQVDDIKVTTFDIKVAKLPSQVSS